MSGELWTYRARLERLIDADTCEFTVDQGFGSRHVIRVRVADIDAAERYTDAGKAATRWVQEWFNALYHSGDIDNWPLIIQTRLIHGRHGLAQDITFNRFVADVTAAASGESLADAMVAAGHAVKVTP